MSRRAARALIGAPKRAAARRALALAAWAAAVALHAFPAHAQCTGACGTYVASGPAPSCESYFEPGGCRVSAGCMCDSACPEFGDCCPDYIDVCAVPLLFGIFPQVAPTTGGVLTMTGAQFMPTGAPPTATVGGVPCLVLTAAPSQLTCSLPAGVGGGLAARVVDSLGRASNDVAFSYAPPELTALAPTEVPTAGGTLLTLSGANFGAATGSVHVTVGGAPCPIALLAHTQLTCLAPAHSSPGPKPVVVTAANQSSGTVSLWYVTPIDECQLGSHDCHAHAHCEDQLVGYSCVCGPGWQGDGQSCEDIDECAAGACDALASCVNEPGSYQCECPEGYALTAAETCEDIDECATGQASCPAASQCINQPGGYHCQADGCEGALVGAPCDTGLLGVCALGRIDCVADTVQCVAEQAPSPEVCDGLDNDCDGQIDEDFGGPAAPEAMQCPRVVDADHSALGAPLDVGAVASDAWCQIGVSVSATAGPPGASTPASPLVFDSASPTAGYEDLGTPSHLYDGPGGSPLARLSYDPPSLLSVSPASAPTASGVTLTLHGHNFGTTGTALVGDAPCAPIQWSHTSVVCALPDGVGAGLPVRVRVGGQTSAPLWFSYDSGCAPGACHPDATCADTPSGPSCTCSPPAPTPPILAEAPATHSGATAQLTCECGTLGAPTEWVCGPEGQWTGPLPECAPAGLPAPPDFDPNHPDHDATARLAALEVCGVFTAAAGSVQCWHYAVQVCGGDGPCAEDHLAAATCTGACPLEGQLPDDSGACPVEPAPSGIACVHPQEALAMPSLGDVNGSGAVSVTDVQCAIISALAAIAGPEAPAPACAPHAPLVDVNCDGAITIADVQLVVFLALGLGLPESIDLGPGGCPVLCLQ